MLLFGTFTYIWVVGGLGYKGVVGRDRGDFQTPVELARQVCKQLAAMGCRPASIIEPTCGVGGFVSEAHREFSSITDTLAMDIEPSYVSRCRQRLRGNSRSRVQTGDALTTDWQRELQPLPEPLLVVGNPPWVTSAELSRLGSSNLPVKRTYAGLTGFAARTGASNFDISEYILRQFVDALSGRNATLAMLCKTSVARKVLVHAWRQHSQLSAATISTIDAGEHFGAATSACLLVCRFQPGASVRTCKVAPAIGAAPTSTLAWCDEQLVADNTSYRRIAHLVQHGQVQWRSGIKHDCANVMELRPNAGGWRNGWGQPVRVESRSLYPLLKSSDLAHGRAPSRRLLVPQQSPASDTTTLRSEAPQTWKYLMKHAERLDARASSIYRKRPRFSVFGVGAYSFTPWKVAVSGLHKQCSFRVVGPWKGRPVVFDDTSYLLPCQSEQQAKAYVQALGSELAQQYFRAFTFWDMKRPITARLLNGLDLDRLLQP